MKPGERVSERWLSGGGGKVQLQSPPEAYRGPDDRMAPVKLLQKSGEGDFLRALAEVALRILMEADV